MYSKGIEQVEFEAIFAPISGAIKSTSDGGARITIEVDEVTGLAIHTFKLALDGGPMEVTLTKGKVKTYG